MSQAATHKKQTIISSKGLSAGRQIREVVTHPDLLLTLTWRDLKIRYAQTLLGFTWSIVQPLFGLVSLFVVFYKLANISTGDIPYLSFALSGLIFWNYFYFVIQQSAVALVSMQAVIKKIYFPRLSIPLSKTLLGLLDWSIALLLLIAVLFWQDSLSLHILWCLPVLLATMISALGLGLLVSSFSIRYRDLQQITPFFLQILFFLTPVAYPAGILQQLMPEDYRFLIYINPMTGILEIWRHLLFGSSLNSQAFISVLIGVLLFTAGLWSFARTSKKIADII